MAIPYTACPNCRLKGENHHTVFECTICGTEYCHVCGEFDNCPNCSNSNHKTIDKVGYVPAK